jgi:uncharacterized protein
VKAVVFYESADDAATRARQHFAAHRARWEEFAGRGELLMIGPFASKQEGAMAIFTTRAAAEEFVRGDPLRPARGGAELDDPGVERGPRPGGTARVNPG